MILRERENPGIAVQQQLLSFDDVVGPEGGGGERERKEGWERGDGGERPITGKEGARGLIGDGIEWKC